MGSNTGKLNVINHNSKSQMEPGDVILSVNGEMFLELDSDEAKMRFAKYDKVSIEFVKEAEFDQRFRQVDLDLSSGFGLGMQYYSGLSLT